jgi:hypothetical protein
MRKMLIVALILAFCSPVFGDTIVADPYWRIDETLVEDIDGNNGDGDGDVAATSTVQGEVQEYVNMIGLTITNMHDTLAINGFALTVAPDYLETNAPAGWANGLEMPSSWDTRDYTILGDQTLAEFFGKSFADAFPNYDYGTNPEGEGNDGRGVVFYAASQEEAVPPSIGPGETVGLADDTVETSYLFNYLTGNVPWSDAIVSLTDGSAYIGPTDAPNPFPTDDDDNLSNPVPEPTTLGLLVLGGFGVLRRRRRA